MAVRDAHTQAFALALAVAVPVWPLAAGLSFVASTLAPQSKLQTAVDEVSIRVLRKIDEVARNSRS
jgi:hypothetical protein